MDAAGDVRVTHRRDNERLFTAKLAVGGQLDEYVDRQGSTGNHYAGDISGSIATRQWNKSVTGKGSLGYA